jgi:L-alanine-DL-glutamate epimerase-like enolase superfamily enzyme/DNA-binding FadR family transcriptional regulator
MSDRIRHLKLSHVVLPLETPVSDAKVLTGRQKPLTETVLLFVEILTEQGQEGMGFSYSKRAGGRAQYAHLEEIAGLAVGQDPSDIDRIYQSLLWAGASVGRSGVATQAIAALDVALWDLKARRAGLPLAKLIGAQRDSCPVYNTSGGFLQASVEEIQEKATASLASGIGGIKIKVGQPDWKTDLARVAALREHLGETPFMVDANQQWDRARARRMCRELEAFDLVWIEEPVDAWDAVGHADLSRTFDTPIATGEMLTSVSEHVALLEAGYRGIVQPDAPRIGGITPFLKFATLAAHAGLALAPHYAMEIHLHLAATYPTEPWVEHFEWLNPLFNERIETTLAQRVVTGLKDKILAGDLPPGHKLPSEAELIEEYAVSRTVVREAVTRLRAEGLVETFQGRGSFVLAMPEPTSFTVESAAIRTHHDVLDMIDFRLGIECEAAALAAARVNAAGAESIRAALDAFVAAAPEEQVDADFGFHRAVAAASGNRFYLDLLDSLGPMMIMLPRTRLGDAYSLTDAGHVDRVRREHDNVASAVVAGDPDIARAAMRVHLGNTRRRLDAR